MDTLEILFVGLKEKEEEEKRFETRIDKDRTK